MKNLLFYIITLFTLCSCGELKEEIWVYPNKDVRLEVSISMGKEQGSGMLSPALGLLNACLGNDAMDGSSIAERAESENFAFDTVILLKNQPALRYDSLLLDITRKDRQNLFTKQEREKLARALNRLTQASQVSFNADSRKNSFTMAFKMGRTSWNDLLLVGQGMQKMNATYDAASANSNFFFTIEKDRFIRGNYLINANVLNLRLQDRYAGIVKLLGDNNYTYVSIVHLPGKTVHTDNALSVISNDGKTVTTTLTLDDLSAGNTIGNTVQFE